jgi:hypothetical protein
MNLDELKAAWNTQNDKWDYSISLNKTLLKTINLDKSEDMMHRIMMWRIVEATVFFLIIVSLWNFIISHLAFSAPTISAFILNVFAIIGLAGNIGQIALIAQIDFSGSVSTVQRQIHEIRSHNLKTVKLTFLSIPFHMAYVFLGFKICFGIDLYEYLNHTMLTFYIILSLILVPPTIWFYRKMNFRNTNPKWVRRLVEELGGRQLLASADFLGKIDELD